MHHAITHQVSDCGSSLSRRRFQFYLEHMHAYRCIRLILFAYISNLILQLASRRTSTSPTCTRRHAPAAHPRRRRGLLSFSISCAPSSALKKQRSHSVSHHREHIKNKVHRKNKPKFVIAKRTRPPLRSSPQPAAGIMHRAAPDCHPARAAANQDRSVRAHPAPAHVAVSSNFISKRFSV